MCRVRVCVRVCVFVRRVSPDLLTVVSVCTVFKLTRGEEQMALATLQAEVVW